MSYLKEFYDALGLKSEFDKVVASAAFFNFVQCDVTNAIDKGYQDLVEDSEVVIGTKDFARKKILEDLYDKATYLLSMSGIESYERLNTEPIIDNDKFIQTAIEYVESHKIPFDIVEDVNDSDPDFELTDEIWDASIKYLGESIFAV